jgi:hypothetical protein
LQGATGPDSFVLELIEFDTLRATKSYSQRQTYTTRRNQNIPGSGQAYNPPVYAPSTPFQQLSSTQAANDFMGGLSRQPTRPPTPRFQILPYSDTRLPTIQARNHPQTGTDTLSYLDRSRKRVSRERLCQHCDAGGKNNGWHFDFACADMSNG